MNTNENILNTVGLQNFILYLREFVMPAEVNELTEMDADNAIKNIQENYSIFLNGLQLVHQVNQGRLLAIEQEQVAKEVLDLDVLIDYWDKFDEALSLDSLYEHFNVGVAPIILPAKSISLSKELGYIADYMETLEMTQSNNRELSKNGLPTLLKAILENHLPLAKLILEHGVNINEDVTMGITPLHIAASKGSLEMLKLLLSHGADINAMDNEDYTPLLAACESLKYDNAIFLASKGADTKLKNKHNQSVPDLLPPNLPGHTDYKSLLQHFNSNTATT